MKYTTGAALLVAAMLTGTLFAPDALAGETATVAESKTAVATSQALQQELDARLQKDAEAVAADAMTAASDLKLPLQIERLSPATLVLVSEL